MVFEPGVAVERGVDASSHGLAAARQDHVTHATRAALTARAEESAFANLVGQAQVVENLQLAARGAVHRGEPLPHILLYGPPGLGKTTLAHAVAAEAGAVLHVICAPMLRDPGVLLQRLALLGAGDVLFLDEIHRLPDRVAEVLYEAMEDCRLSLPVQCGPHQRTMHVNLAGLAVIGATTEEDLVPAPLLSRFPLRERLEHYARDELAEIARRAAAHWNLQIDDDAADLLAGASRDAARNALALLRCVRDDPVVLETCRIDRAAVSRTLTRRNISAEGLEKVERDYLELLSHGPIGRTAAAAKLRVSPKALATVHEPMLLRRGLIHITRMGRVAA